MSSSESEGRFGRRWRWLVSLMAALLALAAVETWLRYDEARAENAAWSFRTPDASRGWALKPGFRGWVTGENDVWVEINSDGLRDREHPLVKPPNVMRVAVLGDSYMQAVTLPREKNFSTLLETALSRCVTPAARQAEVINFGVSGYGTAQELLTYRSHASRYRPDLVILAVYTGNDIFDNYQDLHESFSQDIPFFSLRNGQLVVEPPRPGIDADATAPWYQRIRIAVTEHVRLAHRLWDAYALLRSPFVAPQVPEVAQAPGLSESSRIYPPPLTQQMQEAWRLTEALILQLAAEVRANDSELWMVTLSNVEQVNPDRSARQALARALGIDSLLYPDLRLRDFAQAHSIPIVSLAEPLAEYAAVNQVFLNGGYNDRYPAGTGHWNETAHRLAAGLVGEQLCAQSRAVMTVP